MFRHMQHRSPRSSRRCTRPESTTGRSREPHGGPGRQRWTQTPISSTTRLMKVELNSDSPEELYLQIASSIRGTIASGDAQPGAVLPPAKALAQAIGVNRLTVLRAYHVLRDEGLVSLRRGLGATVTTDRVTSSARLRLIVEGALREAKRAGLDDEQLFDLMRSIRSEESKGGE
ncbi:hypothetical protein BFL43_18875 [Williamsia sp. 1135]|nr:hypothetical protein BFL43_18875 [Williamsia sp. 1135]